MTEYGPGRGSQPWHPQDPLYGDPGWDDGRSAAQQGGGYERYGDPAYRPQQQYDPYFQGQFGTDAYGNPVPAATWEQQPQHPGQQHPYDPSYGMGATDPYGMAPVDPYAQGPHGGYDPYEAGRSGGQEHPPPYGQDEYGRHLHQGYPEPDGEYPPRERTAPGPDPETGWDPGPDRGEHAFFSGAGDEDERPDEDDGDVGKKSGKKRRGGCAKFLLTLIVVAGMGGAGWFAWERFAPAPDFPGKGTGSAQVEIPENATISDMGNVLKKQGVVKSHDAFVEAASENGGDRIQGGNYSMRKQMSASEAVKLMLDPASQNALIIPEGSRNRQIYALVDEKTGQAAGTTEKIAKTKYRSLGLPSWANGPGVKDPLEGFLYPSRYAVGEEETPEQVLRKMVTRAEKRYEGMGLAGKAKKVGLDSPFEVLSVASLVQAEGRTHSDFRKMSEVVYNRLKTGNTETNGMLEFDSTYNYIKNQSKIDLTVAELRNYKNRYNTYYYKGLPPGPIGNPGDDALRAAVNPDNGGWYYFISLDNNTSQFTRTYAQHEKLVEKFRKQREGN